VFGQAAEVHLGVTELALDHPERVFDLGAYLRLARGVGSHEGVLHLRLLARYAAAFFTGQLFGFFGQKPLESGVFVGRKLLEFEGSKNRAPLQLA
jgi:hypothetical protein